MQNERRNLFTRQDTLFGVCEALGQDFGFNPVYLRIALPLLLFFQPVATIAGYFGAGLIVLASRLLAPDPRRPVVEANADAAAIEQPVEALPLAA